MTVRLHWTLDDHQEGGAFTLRGAPLYLVVSTRGVLDLLHQDPGDRDGFTVHEDPSGSLRILCRGSCRSAGNQGDGGEVVLPFGEKVLASFGDFHWELSAEGKVEVQDPLVGTEFGGHRVVARLGNGAMGVVYRAVQINLDREVALKVLDPKAAKSSPLAVASFKREAIAAGRLSHPNLVQVYDVGQDRGLYFFSMELVPAGDLEDRLKESGPLPWQDALVHLLDAAEALQFAQEHHLVHRDVKPENLMLTVDGRTKLADLGMATTRGMVEQQAAGGTPHFLAPECVSGEHADHRSDFYSLGCTLFRLLTAETPYQGDSVREILRAHRDAPIPELKEHGVDAPAGVQEMLSWMMAKDPLDRPQHAHEIVEEIHDLLDGKRSRGLVLGLSVVAVAAVAVSLFFALKPPAESDPEQVIVEVDSGAAQQERERAERLEVELAFTTAMGAPEGKDRILALQSFQEAYPDSDFTDPSDAELARLASLPEIPKQPLEAEDPFAAEKAQLKELEAAFLPLMEGKRFGEARHLLGAATLSAEWMAALWSRLETGSLDAFSTWEADHLQALGHEDWQAASRVRGAFESSLQGLPDVPPEWSQRLNALHVAAEFAEGEADRRDYRLARLDVLAAMRSQVVPAMDRWDLATAAEALEVIQAACRHEELQAAIAARVPILNSAAQTQEALFSALSGESMIDITEARDGKRAFATGAQAEGLELLVQVSGERIERVDPWPLYATPTDLPRLLDDILGPQQEVDARRSLMLLLASHSLAQELSTWTTLPSPEQAQIVQSLCEDWLDLLHGTPFVAGSVGAEETFAIQEFAQLATTLADGDTYAAFLHAQALQDNFSLLGLWSSDGASTWGFRP